MSLWARLVRYWRWVRPLALLLVLLVVAGCSFTPPVTVRPLERVKALSVAVCEPREPWQDCLVRLEALPPDPPPPPPALTPETTAAIITATVAALAAAFAVVWPVATGAP